MSDRGLFYVMSNIHQIERVSIMQDVFESHLNALGDDTTVFAAKDVAIIPPGTPPQKRYAAGQRSSMLLRQMTGCVEVVKAPKGIQFKHTHSPLRDGLSVCANCGFHNGNTRGTILLPCPENIAARKIESQKTPSIANVPDHQLMQPSLLSEF